MSALKQCFKCQGCFPPSEFYRHPMMGDGHLGKCKACTKKDVWLNLQRKQLDPEWVKKERARCVKKETERAKRLKDTPKYRARLAVANAVARGNLVRPGQCSDCGKGCHPDAHHQDYRKPLEVQWLCRVCHTKAHGRYRADLRQETP